MIRVTDSSWRAVRYIALVVVLSIAATTASGAVAAAGPTDVTVTPSTDTIDAGTTTKFNITVKSASGGVGSYDFDFSTDGSGTASISNINLYGNPGTKQTSISDDGSTASVTAGLANTADSGQVTLATITVTGTAAGQTSLSLVMNSLGDESGSSYSIGSTNDASLSVRKSTAIQNVNTSPDNVDESTTEPTTFDYDVINVSNDGRTDDFTLTAPVGVNFDVSPTATVSAADGTSINVTAKPTLSNVNGGTANQISFSIAPDSTVDTSRINVQLKTDVTYPSVSSNRSLDFTFDVVDSSGETAIRQDTVSVTAIESGGQTASQIVSLTPKTQKVSTDGTATYDLVVGGVTNGVSSFNVTVQSGNSSIAEITDGTQEIGGAASVTTIDVAGDGSSVDITAGLGSTATTGNITIATIDVAGQNVGSTDVTTTVNALGDAQGNPYNVSKINNATAKVTSGPGDVTGNGKAAVDTDGDGKYENVNGDKRVNINDVQALFAASNAGQIKASDTAFDFNNDTRVDINDVQALFTEV